MDADGNIAAYDVLGLPAGATEEQIKRAYARQKAFWSDGSSHESIKKLATAMIAKVDQAYSLLSLPSTTATSSGSTTADTTIKVSKPTPGGDKTTAWIVSLLVIGGLALCWIDDWNRHKPVPVPQPTPVIPDVVPPVEKLQPISPPDYIAPFLHDATKSVTFRWTTQDVSTPGATRTAASGYDKSGRLVNFIVLYPDGGRWRLYEQYLVRYSDDGTEVGVQLFEYEGQSDALVFKDRRNVSEVGDVLTRTTLYRYHFSGSKAYLDTVSVSTPFNENVDGLQYERDSNNNLISVTRQGGFPIRLDANRDNLPHMFGLWREFGQYN